MFNILVVEDNLDLREMLSAALGDAGYRAIGAENGEGSFSDDSEIADYAKGAVYALKDKGIISGREDGSFDPYGKCTRAECAVMISKAID